MPIDRGPFNLLQDDDGSNLTGTIWNKDTIKTVLLDPIDAMHPSSVFVPTGELTFGANVGTWTIASGEVSYVFGPDKVMDLSAYLNNTTTTGAATNLSMAIPAGRVAERTVIGPAYVNHPGFPFEVGVAIVTAGGTTVALHRPALGAYGIGSVAAYFTVRIPLI